MNHGWFSKMMLRPFQRTSKVRSPKAAKTSSLYSKKLQTYSSSNPLFSEKVATSRPTLMVAMMPLKLSIQVLVRLFIVISSLRFSSSSFQTSRASCNHRTVTKARRTTRKTTSLSSVGNWVSAVTNTPPSTPLLTPELQVSLVSNTILQGKELARVYRATSDGWSAIDFHRGVDEKGSCLVVALTRSGQLIGGYNPVGWRSTDDYYNSNAAFLWYEQGGKGIKCPVLSGGTYGNLNRLYEPASSVCVPFFDTPHTSEIHIMIFLFIELVHHSTLDDVHDTPTRKRRHI